MASTGCEEDASGRQWDRLPIHIWERIFSFLPVSSLAVSTSVCRSWSALVRSRIFRALYPIGGSCRTDDLYFLLFMDESSPWAATYLPFTDRWMRFPLPAVLVSSPALPVPGKGRLLLTWKRFDAIVVCDAFTGLYRLLPPLFLTGPPPYPVAIIAHDGETYRVVVVSTFDWVVSQVYESRTDCWELKGELPGCSAVVGDAVYLSGLLYCLCSSPQGNQLLSFDPVSGQWAECNIILPLLVRPHIFTFSGYLYLAGGLEDQCEVTGVGVWVLSSGTWKEVASMPSGLFRSFSAKHLFGFHMFDHEGIIGFCNKFSDIFCMFDLSTMKWWRTSPCPFKISLDRYQWLGHALKPSIDVIKPTDDG